MLKYVAKLSLQQSSDNFVAEATKDNTWFKLSMSRLDILLHVLDTSMLEKILWK
jgi:hypothetical protein